MSPRARAGVVATALAVLLAVAAWTLSAPDTGGPVVVPPDPEPPVPVRPAPVGHPLPRAAIAAPTPVDELPPGFPDHPEGPEFEARPAQPWEPPALDKEYRAETRGLAEAALARRDRLRDCWNDYLDRVGAEEDLGRFTIQMSVERGDDGESSVEAVVVNADSDPVLDRCVSDAVADARFADPGPARLSIVWPVPIPTLPGEIP